METKKQFYTQLDGLRAFAVVGVMISHWVFLDFVQKLGLGFWGVNLFFVLSGFLITEILLKQINKKDNSGQILKSFYIKRTLRIFPIYYLYMVVMYIFNFDNARDVAGYTFTYTLNFYNEATHMYTLGHVWSLCVEEQFYIIWPFLLLLFKPKHHLRLIIIAIMVALFFRLGFTLFNVKDYSIYNYRMMPASMDALGLGALLAYLKLFKIEVLKKILRFSIIPIVALIGYFIFVFNESPMWNAGEEVVSRFFVSVCSFFLIGKTVFEYKNLFGKLLQSRLLQYLGKISYGLYLYHLIVSKLFSFDAYLTNHFPSFLPGILKYNVYVITGPTYFIITVLLASLSYYFIEKPFLKIKDGINYRWVPKVKTV